MRFVLSSGKSSQACCVFNISRLPCKSPASLTRSATEGMTALEILMAQKSLRQYKRSVQTRHVWLALCVIHSSISLMPVEVPCLILPTDATIFCLLSRVLEVPSSCSAGCAEVGAVSGACAPVETGIAAVCTQLQPVTGPACRDGALPWYHGLLRHRAPST